MLSCYDIFKKKVGAHPLQQYIDKKFIYAYMDTLERQKTRNSTHLKENKNHRIYVFNDYSTSDNTDTKEEINLNAPLA